MSTTENNKITSKPLSALAIKTMKPSDKVKSDTGENSGLRITCGTTGKKAFVYRYRSPVTEKITQIKIGDYPQISLAEARVALRELKELRSTGLCPKSYFKDQREEARRVKELETQERENKVFTVEKLCELYLTQHIEDRMVDGRRIAGARKPKGQSETRRTLYGDAVKVLGELPARSITRKVVVEMIMSIVARGANVQAGNVLRELSAAYEYAIGLEKFDDDFANPAVLAKASLKQAKVKLTSTKGRRVLSDKELAQVLKWLPGSGFSMSQKQIFKLTLWTGCRTGEVCAAEWQDINLDEGTWHIRAPKNDADRHVQLPRQAVEFLEQHRLVTDKYLFASERTGKPILQKSLTEIKWHLQNPDKVKAGSYLKPNQLWPKDMENWAPHDLRRTVRTGLSKMGCRSEVAEAILGHSRSGIEGTYDLHGYEAECKEWLQKWADYMDFL
jgi:integrase